MSNYNVIENEIANGKAMLARSFVNNEFAKQEIPCNLDKGQEKQYRYSLFTGYQQWVTKVSQLGLSDGDSLVIYAEVKQAAYRGLAKYRAGFEAPAAVAEEVAVAINKVAELKALVAALIAEKNEALDVAKNALELVQQTNINVEASSQNVALCLSQIDELKLAMRHQANSGVTTKVYKEVVSKVGI